MKTLPMLLPALAMGMLLVPPSLRAQEQPVQGPPPGWKEGKVGNLGFWLPAKTVRSGQRTRNLTLNGRKYSIQTAYALTADGLTLEAALYQLPLSAVRTKTTAQIQAEFVEVAAAMLNGTASEPVSLDVHKLRVKEFLVTAGQNYHRVRILGSRTRVYQLVASGGKEQVVSPTAQLFLDSLRPVEKEEKATKTPLPKEETKKTNVEPAKVGNLTWTMTPKDMAFPETPAAGKILGKEFKVEKATWKGNSLELRQGPDFFPTAALRIVIFLPAGQSLEGQKLEITPTSTKNPHVYLKKMDPGERLPKGPSFTRGYAMKLEFGTAQGGQIPGRIYACFPDSGQSVVAGTFFVNKP